MCATIARVLYYVVVNTFFIRNSWCVVSLPFLKPTWTEDMRQFQGAIILDMQPYSTKYCWFLCISEKCYIKQWLS